MCRSDPCHTCPHFVKPLVVIQGFMNEQKLWFLFILNQLYIEAISKRDKFALILFKVCTDYRIFYVLITKVCNMKPLFSRKNTRKEVKYLMKKWKRHDLF